MALFMSFLIVILAAAVVVITADFAINSSVKVAKRFKMSDELIGMTILAIGTSIPEIITHIVGSYKILKNPSLMNELSGLVIGTNIGSDIFQQNFIIGLVGIVGIIIVRKKDLIKDVGSLVGAAVLLLLFCYGGVITRIEGAILFILYIAYLYLLKKYGMTGGKGIKLDGKGNGLANNLFIIIASFAIMTYAADRMIFHSELLVRQLPISASFFGIIMLGVTTAFPELTTSLIAVFKHKAEISAGILIGSNITNPMLALGLGAMISSYTVPNVVVWYDLPFKIITGLLLFWMLIKGKLRKWHAVVLILLYLGFLIFRNIYFPVDF
ncbi:sodium:calcium antiporter [Candidatus Woesearchaeota archaeon]|nr:sodium:calcium antiporter [Candidatus Woesearchaeota archaeon]